MDIFDRNESFRIELKVMDIYNNYVQINLLPKIWILKKNNYIILDNLKTSNLNLYKYL